MSVKGNSSKGNHRLLLMLMLLMLSTSGCSGNHETVAVIYSTDLFHPPGDMDDQVDLAVLCALPWIDLRFVVLDGKSQAERPGSIPLRQISHLTGRVIPSASGLKEKLKSMDDEGLNQPEDAQEAVRGILQTLQHSRKRICIITVGSLRDIAAAYNRNPALFHEKVDRVLVFAGEASRMDFLETNVRLDPVGFAVMMRSGLPIYWFPCFDGGLWKNNGKATYWQTNYRQLLEKVSQPLLQYFLYSYTHAQGDPIGSLSVTVDNAAKEKMFEKKRNLWCGVLFCAAADQVIVKQEGGYGFVPRTSAPEKEKLFEFVPVRVDVSPKGLLSYVDKGQGRLVQQFRVKDTKEYGAVMTSAVADLLATGYAH